MPGVCVCMACCANVERISVYPGYASLLLRPSRISVVHTPKSDQRWGTSEGSILGEAIVC